MVATTRKEYDDTEDLDRLILLLVSQPRPGWEEEFSTLVRKEIGRLKPSVLAGECGDE